MVNINKKTLKFYVYGTFFYCFIGIQDNLASYINNDIKNKENKNKVIKNNKGKKTTKEISKEGKKEIDKKEIKKRERKIEVYKREIKKLKEKINENFKKEEEINVQKERECVIINKKKEIVERKLQVLVEENNKKISELKKFLENLQKIQINKKNEKKIQKDIKEEKTEITRLKIKNDNILLNNKKDYEEKIKNFNNKFSIKIEKIKALNKKIQKKIIELENLIDVIQREIDIISEKGYEYFIQYNKKEKSLKREEDLNKTTEENKEEELFGEENGKEEENFDFITKNKVFGIKNSSILIDSNFSWENKLYENQGWIFFNKDSISDKSSYSLKAKSDFYLDFNRAKENKIYKKFKFSVNFDWKQDLDIAQMFLKEVVKKKNKTWDKKLITEIEVKYNFYQNKNIKIGFATGYRGHPWLNDREKYGYEFDDTGIFPSFIIKWKKIKTSFQAGVDIGKVEGRGILPLILLKTKTKFKYFDLNNFFSIKILKNEEKVKFKVGIIILQGDLKFKNIKYIEDTSVKIYFYSRYFIFNINDKENNENKETFIRISPKCKICLNQMKIFKILGVEKFKCKLNLELEYKIPVENITKNNNFKGNLDLNIGILKLKESRFKNLGKLQLNLFNCNLEYSRIDVYFNNYIFDVFVGKYNILKGLSLYLHLFKFQRYKSFSSDENINFIYSWVPSLKIKFDIAKYLLAKKEK